MIDNIGTGTGCGSCDAATGAGRDHGKPGLRPHHDPDSYVAFVPDRDGIDVEAVCRQPE